MTLTEDIARAREAGDFAEVAAKVPLMAAMGIGVSVKDGTLLATMAFSEPLIGNFAIRALHGGTLGALLESAAAFELMWTHSVERIPRVVGITVEYLRSGKAVETFARAEVVRAGRRVANVHAWAWQDDIARPIAAAHARFLV